MVIKMIFISVLILAILFATWVKDGDKMNPPLKRRALVDLTVIGVLWLLYAIFKFSADPSLEGMAEQVITWGMWYFIGTLVYLMASISELFKGLVTALEKAGFKVPKKEQGETDE